MRFFLFTFKQLFIFDLYFGYLKKYLDASTNFLLLGKKNNFLIFNLNITLIYLKLALNFLFNLYFKRGFVWIIEGAFKDLINIYFKFLKKYSLQTLKYSIIKSSLYLNFFFFRDIWLHGLLTNYKNVKKSLVKFKTIPLSKDDKFRHFKKFFNYLFNIFYLKRDIKSFLFNKKKYNKIKKNFFYPTAIFFFEYSKNLLKIKECIKSFLPIICIIDTNANIINLNNVYIIPSNEKTLKINYFYYKLFLLFFFKNLYYNVILFKKQTYLKSIGC